MFLSFVFCVECAQKLYVVIHQNMEEEDEIIEALSEVDGIQEGQARSVRAAQDYK